MPNKDTSTVDDNGKASGGSASPPDAHVLICDDDGELRRLVADFLQGHGYAVSTAADGRELARHVRSATPIDLVVLDIMLPGQSGLEICRDFRLTSNVPILMLTARGNESDRIAGLEMGADDYMSKPFSSAELLARIKALLRRSRMVGAGSLAGNRRTFEFEGWKLDITRRELRNPANVIIDLSAGEFDLLLAFLDAPQRVLSREQLLDAARNKTSTAFDRSIDVQISRLRRKIGAPDDNEGFIKTVRGSGYLFVPSVVPK